MQLNSTCSIPCGTPSSWLEVTTTAVLNLCKTGHMQKKLGFKRWRDPSKRRTFFRPACGSLGIHCEFLPIGNRWLIPILAQQLGFRGPSVEVGVFRGQFSLEILRHYKSGGTHLLVDAWANFNTSCNQALALVKRNHKGIVGDKQCRFSQSKFDAIFEEVRDLFTKKYAHRTLIQRNLSDRAAATVARQSLDFQYIDARHDYEGVLEDLRAWWPKLCPGGLMAGHDYDNVNGMPVARAVGEFVRSLGPSPDGSKPTVFITSDHPPSWFFFRPPRPCSPAPTVTVEGS